MLFVVKAMSQADRDLVNANPAADQGGQELFPIDTWEAFSVKAAERKLKQLINKGVYPSDAVVDPAE